MSNGKALSWWLPGDWNGFFGLFTNVLTNIIVLAGLLSGALDMPNEIVFGRVIPAVGLATLLGNLVYAWLAKRLAEREGRADVTALPFGISVPHMFIVVFVVVAPIYSQTGDATLAWKAGMAWAFIEGLIEIAGAFLGRTIREVTPRSAILGTLAGASILFIAMRPAMQTWEVPFIGFVSLAIILLGWFGDAKFPFDLPAGLIAIVAGTVLGWATGFMELGPLVDAANDFAVQVPIPWIGSLIEGFSVITPYLVIAIPFGIYNFFETMSNVESAAAAGDEYDTRTAMLIDGLTSSVGALFGSMFPTAVYIGHPGWKNVGARIGYSVATGIVTLIVTVGGVLPLLVQIVPLVALLPILLYIGLVIGAQAFQSVPKAHAPAVVLALIPWIANWAQSQIDSALEAAGTTAQEVGYDTLADSTVIYEGMATLGAGNIVVGLILGAIAAFVIDRRFHVAAGYAALGAVLSYFGAIHASELGIGVATDPAIGYTLMTAVFLWMHYSGADDDEEDEANEPSEEEGQPATA